MLWYKTIKVSITAPAPSEKFGFLGMRLKKRWTVKVVLPADLHVSPIFVVGLYEDLANHVGIKTGDKSGR